MRKTTLIAFGTLWFVSSANAAIRGFVEDFSGGKFTPPPWTLITETVGKFSDHGYVIDGVAYEELQGEVDGRGSFRSTVEFSGFATGTFMSLRHRGRDSGFIVSFFDDAGPQRVFPVGSVEDFGTAIVPPSAEGTVARLELVYDEPKAAVTFSYDNNIADDTGPRIFGPAGSQVEFDGLAGHPFQYRIRSVDVVGPPISGVIHSISVVPLYDLGDVNEDGALTVQDVDLLSEHIRNKGNESPFDLDHDVIVDELDRDVWVHSLKNTFFGDSNLDGEFSSADLVTVFESAEYEDNIEGNSTWADGDWNGDGDFTTRDLVFAFQDGGYEQGPRRAVQSVPEPSMSTMILLGAVCVLTLNLRRPTSASKVPPTLRQSYGSSRHRSETPRPGRRGCGYITPIGEQAYFGLIVTVDPATQCLCSSV